MSLLHASLRLLPALALVAACTGKRADPEPSTNPPPISNEGGAGGSAATNGGGPSTGGMGGAPSTGGMGGVPSTGGMGGMPATGVGGSTFNDVSDMYPYCGCLDDSHEPGACTTCFDTAANDPTLCAPPGACAAGCQQIVAFLRNDPTCTDIDEACLQAAYALAPEEWDDAVDQVQCACTECPLPFGCNPADCAAN